jgi:hypothetical protein
MTHLWPATLSLRDSIVCCGICAHIYTGNGKLIIRLIKLANENLKDKFALRIMFTSDYVFVYLLIKE